MLLTFNVVWPGFFCETACVCPQYSYRGKDMIFWIFAIVHCQAFSMWHNWQRFALEFHLRSSPSAFSGYGWSVDQLITSLLTSPCSRNPTRSKQLSTVAVLGFQFGFYRVVVPLSFLRSISLASLSSSLSIFGWWDRLKILRNLAAFSFAVLCIIVFILKLLGFVRCLSHEFSFDHI